MIAFDPNDTRLTAYALKEEEEKSLSAGCDQHLPKPIKKATFLAAVSRIASQRRSAA